MSKKQSQKSSKHQTDERYSKVWASRTDRQLDK